MHPMTGMAVFAWVLTSADESAHVKGANDIWTNPMHMSSYRVELAGIYNMLTCVTRTLDLQAPLKV